LIKDISTVQRDHETANNSKEKDSSKPSLIGDDNINVPSGSSQPSNNVGHGVAASISSRYKQAIQENGSSSDAEVKLESSQFNAIDDKLPRDGGAAHKANIKSQ